MGVSRVGVAHLADKQWIIVVSHVHQSQTVLVVAKADLVALVASVRSVVNDTLDVVDISVVTEAGSKCWIGGVVDINDVQTACHSIEWK